MAGNEDFKAYLLANIRRDLEILHSNKWMEQGTLDGILAQLDSAEHENSRPQSTFAHQASNTAEKARRHTMGHAVALPNKAKKPPAPAGRAPSARPSAKALYDNEAVEEDDLAFKEGDMITGFEKGMCHCVFLAMKSFLCTSSYKSHKHMQK